MFLLFNTCPSYSDDDLEKAIQLSQQEALEKEKKERERLERENTQNLFGVSR